MVRTLIQFTAIILTFEASWFLLQGNLGLTIKDIAEVSATKYEYNSNVVTSLSQQAVDNWIGFSLLLLAFSLQLANSLWEMRWKDFAFSKAGMVLSFVAGAIVFYVCDLLSNKKGSTMVNQVMELLEKQ
jgi:hypothetical protein